MADEEREVPTDKESKTAPRRVKVTVKPRDDKKIPEPRGGEDKKDGEEKKFSKWRPVPLCGEDARANQSGSNCAGVTFGKGCVYIDTDQMQTILDGNYHFKFDAKHLDKTDRVCCVVAWGEKDQWHHAALIVDQDEDGTPIVYGKDGDKDVISEYKAGDYSPDWKVYCRVKTPDSVELEALTQAYKKAQAQFGPHSAEAKLAAYRMCQRRNALQGI